MTIWIILMIIFGIVCASIASSKNRSSFGWFIIGALTGIIGLIIIIALPKK